MARRSGAGPAPDPNSLREAARLEAGLIRTLPKERVGRVPAWPLATRASTAERALWTKLWKLPQAIIWEEQGVERAVARYVRQSIVVESGDVPAAKVKTVTDAERTLLLELGALLKAGYRISSGQVTTGSLTAADQRRKQIPSSRGRLQALPRIPQTPDE